MARLCSPFELFTRGGRSAQKGLESAPLRPVIMILGRGGGVPILQVGPKTWAPGSGLMETQGTACDNDVTVSTAL